METCEQRCGTVTGETEKPQEPDPYQPDRPVDPHQPVEPERPIDPYAPVKPSEGEYWLCCCNSVAN